MERLILDTSFLIDAERSGSPFDGAIADEDDVAIAAVTVAELLTGVALADKKHGPSRARFVDAVMEAIPTLEYDVRVARAHATLLAHVRHSGTRRGAHDLIIAATALTTQRTVVTRDGKGFGGLPGVVVRQS